MGSVPEKEFGDVKVAVIAHVFYPEFWTELARCIRTVGDGCDLFVTYVDESAVAAARRDFPSARFIACENLGYDVWPFLKVLQEIPLADYDLVVKLHTKRDVTGELLVLNHAWVGGPVWRERLLAFVATEDAWRRTLRRFTDPRVGMVADRRLVFRRGDLPAKLDGSFDRAREEFRRLTGSAVSEGAEYVAGTMFAARPAALKPLLVRRFEAARFEPPAGHRCETYAHLMERMLGFSVAAAGLRIAAFNGSLVWRRRYYGRDVFGKLCRFLFQVKHDSGSGVATTRVLHVPVRRRGEKT